jgi:type I restriction enzyme S subunit
VYLKNIANLITKGTTPQYFVENGINFIKTECFVDDSIDQDKCLFVDEKTHNNFLSRSILKENDILFAIAGSIGKCNIVLKEILPANTNQALAIIRLKDEKTIGYVLQVLKSILIQEYIYLNVSAGAQPNLSLEQIGNFSFPLPPLPEQQAITTILKTTDETIQGIQELIKKLELRNK